MYRPRQLAKGRTLRHRCVTDYPERREVARASAEKSNSLEA